MWFKNLQVFRLTTPWKITAEELHAQLSRIAFSQCASNEMQSQGWASPRNNDQLVHSVNQQFLISLATEKKLLPSSVINQVTKARALEIEEEQGFAPGRKAMKDLKERITEELLPRAFGVKRNTNVWIDPVNRWLVIDASSPSKADEVIKLLLKCCDKLPLEGLRTKTSPQAAMTGWLAGNEAPKGFTIDQDTELKSSTEDKATVRYVRYTLEPDDIQKHITAGKQCTKLALTWDDKVSFVLTDTLTIKRIKPLDVLDESKDKGSNEEERFDADFVLMTAELASLLSDVVFALDGEMDSAQAA
ncbi:MULTISPECIES: recombination-associated protein RdgC [unclassified Undibacterium]|uniref:recombination-associated protein RdgC n=1 Tax=unclassified Undibacterium TaxID=2630295 RepID=UPI001331EFAC|nr:recombination-associated protein RdgC [Undibacterium sp. KW1]BBB63702.1 recombination-associated protein RdgC [Undibacterium sp. KW1]